MKEMKPGLLEAYSDPKRFRKIFLSVYLLVTASDWLQVILILP